MQSWRSSQQIFMLYHRNVHTWSHISSTAFTQVDLGKAQFCLPYFKQCGATKMNLARSHQLLTRDGKGASLNKRSLMNHYYTMRIGYRDHDLGEYFRLPILKIAVSARASHLSPLSSLSSLRAVSCLSTRSFFLVSNYYHMI